MNSLLKPFLDTLGLPTLIISFLVFHAKDCPLVDAIKFFLAKVTNSQKYWNEDEFETLVKSHGIHPLSAERQKEAVDLFRAAPPDSWRRKGIYSPFTVEGRQAGNRALARSYDALINLYACSDKAISALLAYTGVENLPTIVRILTDDWKESSNKVEQREVEPMVWTCRVTFMFAMGLKIRHKYDVRRKDRLRRGEIRLSLGASGRSEDRVNGLSGPDYLLHYWLPCHVPVSVLRNGRGPLPFSPGRPVMYRSAYAVRERDQDEVACEAALFAIVEKLGGELGADSETRISAAREHIALAQYKHCLRQSTPTLGMRLVQGILDHIQESFGRGFGDHKLVWEKVVEYFDPKAKSFVKPAWYSQRCKETIADLCIEAKEGLSPQMLKDAFNDELPVSPLWKLASAQRVKAGKEVARRQGLQAVGHGE